MLLAKSAKILPNVFQLRSAIHNTEFAFREKFVEKEKIVLKMSLVKIFLLTKYASSQILVIIMGAVHRCNNVTAKDVVFRDEHANEKPIAVKTSSE